MQAQALVVWGGWDGHEPGPVSELFRSMLEREGFEIEVSNGTSAFLNLDRFSNLRLIIPVITMSTITPEESASVCAAVRGGVGIAGCHGGMCDSFRNDTEWQFMTGGQWVAHPGNDSVTYTVRIVDRSHPITEGLEDFEITSEQYYLHVDPGISVLAETDFPAPGVGGPHEGNPCRMPQIWTKMYGEGRVFYSAIGHRKSDIEEPVPFELMRRGFLWASGILK
jgi:type 1 glutamine amidotransferase